MNSKLVGFFRSKQISDLYGGARDFSVALHFANESGDCLY